MVVKELKQRADLGYDIIGFIDDEPQKYKNVIQGYRVLGPTSRISEIARKYGVEEAIITIANASSKDIRKIVNLCEEIPLKVKIVPGLFEMLDDKIKVSKIREVDIADLLGRSVVRFENQAAEVISQYRDKRIMITGAGGSIGSELCRQLAAMSPRELILVDKDENSIYEIDQELNDGLAAFKIRPVISNIKNFSRTRWIFEQCRPEVVFHAAAHKHVPLMEYNAAEAILNNVLGTKNVAELADQYQVESFISISTDKAINPTNIMGATKKIGELIVQNIASRSRTRFSCVRFGNVLGSRGSVIPLFQRQIAKGGPITITHPEIRRYFMSIGEAVQLIIQAGSIGQKGEIFVLDMGEPIHILDLAKDLIKLSGYREDDFEIKFIGLRPGEKLFEEMLVDEERAKSTQFKKIFIAPPVAVENPDFSKMLTKLMEAANGNDEPEIINILSALGIGYRRPAAS
jgi:FlaA1/EpsC-like NDP-sugar epimerase